MQWDSTCGFKYEITILQSHLKTSLFNVFLQTCSTFNFYNVLCLISWPNYDLQQSYEAPDLLTLWKNVLVFLPNGFLLVTHLQAESRKQITYIQIPY